MKFNKNTPSNFAPKAFNTMEVAGCRLPASYKLT